jgi:tRNA nucleotidyltransferase (CCA-adding enzyme)
MHPSPADLSRDLRERLAPPARDALDAIVAAAAGAGVYAAGGVPRDLLLGRAQRDLDLVIEADAIAVTREALPQARIVAHARFGTAVATIDGATIDVAMARAETYARPGALPRVRPAAIEEDLRRRDFSANAIALRLNGPPMLLDPCGGVADIAARRLRVLHDASFIDDPTRIFRALRYAARLEFTLDSQTARLLRDGVGFIENLSGERVRREFELIFAEDTAGVTLEACQATGVLRAVHPALRWDAERSLAMTQHGGRAPRALLGFALLSGSASPQDADAIGARLRLTRPEAAAVRAMPALSAVSATLSRRDARPSGVVVLLDRLPVASVAAFAGIAPEPIARQLALRYLDEWRRVKPLLTGRDLQDLGVPAGPQLQRGLQLIRAARLDGWATERDDERALAMRFAKSIKDSVAATSALELLRDD